jgi:hypothetical protein
MLSSSSGFRIEMYACLYFEVLKPGRRRLCTDCSIVVRTECFLALVFTPHFSWLSHQPLGLGGCNLSFFLASEWYPYGLMYGAESGQQILHTKSLPVQRFLVSIDALGSECMIHCVSLLGRKEGRNHYIQNQPTWLG